MELATTIPLVESTPQKRRRHFRFHCIKDATLKVGLSNHRSRISNASQAGVCIEVDKTCLLRPGTNVKVEMPVLEEFKVASNGTTCIIPGTVIRVGTAKHASREYGIRFERMVREQMELSKKRSGKFLIASASAVLAGLICYFKIHNFQFFWYGPFLQAYSIGAAAFVLSRVGLSMLYKEPADNGYFPTISVVIAAKNEEAHIGQTIEHVFRSNYPPHLYEVFAIDDGSTDKTWEEMKKMEAKYPNFRPVRFEKNKGKRHGMAAGAELAKGDILVYIDSDSYIDPDAMYRIVQPLYDPKIGAVSGHVLVAIEEDNFISKMEAVRYYISHRIMKAAESVFGVVTCCPGAFSAYRRSAVMEILPIWLKQRFWGTQATFGDDRSLTNFILKKYEVIYHAGALSLTYVPRTLFQFFRQQLRWKKSWARETTIAVRIMYKKHPVAAFFYYVGVGLTLVSPLIAFRSLVLFPILYSASVVPYVVGIVAVYLLMCLICLYFTQTKYWYYGLVFAGLYLFVLSFQNYYAFATIRRNHWGTR